MRIKKVTIRNFRAIKEAEVYFTDLTALIGENNSGKSSFLKALNAFFNYSDEKKSFQAGEHRYRSRTRPVVQIEFELLRRNAEFENYMSSNNTMEILVKFSNDPRKSVREVKYLNRTNSFESIKRPEDFFKVLEKHYKFIVIPVNRTGDELDKFIQKISGDYLDKITKNRDRISSKMNAVVESIDVRLNHISKMIEEGYPLGREFELIIKMPRLNYKVLLDKLDISLKEKDKAYSVHDSGTGIQSLLAVSIYTHIAKEIGVNVLFAIEEPETNLHPQAQIKFIKSLKKMEENNQIILTTHSPTMVDQLTHLDIVLFRKLHESKNIETKVTQVSRDFWEKTGLEEQRTMKFYRYKNSDFFFAKKIVVVESSIDGEVVEFILNNAAGVSNDDLAILDLGGIKSLKYPVYLFKELDLPFVTIVDKDFFVYYSDNDNKKNLSRGEDGFFRYRYDRFNSSSQEIIDILIPDTNIQKLLLNLLREGHHKKVLQLLSDYNIVVMRYCLEMDLLSTKKGIEKMYDILEIEEHSGNRNSKYVLNNKQKATKDFKNIMQILQNMERRNYPLSFSKIISLVKK
ncbi:ATP-dependent nuclease [Candidatus Enterococcus avicola]